MMINIRFSALILLFFCFLVTHCKKHSAINIAAENPRRLSAGEDLQVPSNTVVFFDGKAYSISETTLTVEWTQTDGLPVIINHPTDVNANFLTPQVFVEQTLNFKLSSTDGIDPPLSDEITIIIYPVSDLSNAEFAFDHLPKQSKAETLHIVNDVNFGFLTWEFTTQPEGESIAFEVSNDRKTLHFTPELIGNYEITITSDMSDISRKVSFFIREEFAFDASKIESNDGTLPIDEIMGMITNQSWISSVTLKKDDLIAVVTEYDSLNILGYDEGKGVIVEYDESSPEAEEALERIKQTKGIHQVYNRFHEGEAVSRMENVLYATNDYDSWDSPPSGDNWHLEKIQAPDAWKITNGSPEVLIGISDGGFSTDHPELKGRVLEELHHSDNLLFMDHGNGVAGTIAAIANNNKGMSGINWQSQIILAANDYSSLRALGNYDKVKVITSSWAIPGYVSKDFNPADPTEAQSRKQEALKATREYRNLANKHPDKLFIWSSGNGINNGKGYNDIYGIPGQFHSPALHFTDGGQIVPQENVLFVAALSQDNRLQFYSNYGQLVEIAAPSHFKSLTSNDYKTFLGTSAAAPVVAGVASIIFSMYPEFTGKEVKDILIKSATEQSTERNTSPRKKPAQNLAHSIPIINADKAAQYAKNILDKQIRVDYEIPDPFTHKIAVNYKPLSEGNRIVAVDVDIEYKRNDSWQSLGRNYADTHKIILELAPDAYEHRLTATLTVDTDNAQKKNFTVETMIESSRITIKATDNTTNGALANTTLSLERQGSAKKFIEGDTNLEGKTQLWLKPGHYKLHAKNYGYASSTQSFTTKKNESLDLNIHLMSIDSNNIGGLDGIVMDGANNPLENATVRLSGGDQTNGFFIATRCDKKGIYSFPSIPKNDLKGHPIEHFIVEASAQGYNTQTDEVIIISGLRRTKNITLFSDKTDPNQLFFDNYETLKSWQSSGLWRRINLSETTVNNQSVERGYTSLAANNGNDSANLPKASSGDFVWWYGAAEHGSYIGSHTENDFAGSGGSSMTAHSGDLVSPSINLTGATTPTLRFKTWWEIEAMNPNRLAFDTMDILISTDGGINFHPLKTLNPYYDPVQLTRKDKPMSSSGFDKEPIWIQEDINLSGYVDEIIQIKFRFNTNDRLHNGFRGWVLDDFELVEIKK